SFSLTLSCLTMPPSRCWTLLRLPSTLITELAITAPLSGAVTAHVPNTPKNSAMIHQPRRASFLCDSSGRGWAVPRSLTTSVGALFAAGLILLRRLTIVVRMSGSAAGKTRGRRGRGGPAQPRREFSARRENLHYPVVEKQNLVDDIERGGPMRD